MLLRFDPFANPLDTLFPTWLADRVPAPWLPAVDVHEDAAGLRLVADLPGLERDDVTLSLDGDVLTLRGERRPVAPEGAATARRERPFGAFTRAFTLPPTVDGERVAAEMKDGVLTVTLPKRAEAQPRKIEIALA